MRLPRIDEFAPRKQDFSWMKYEPNTGLKNHQNSLLIHGSCFNEYLSTSTLLTLLLHDHWMIIFQSRYCRRWRIEACPHQCYPDASPGSNWWITAVNSFPWHRRKLKESTLLKKDHLLSAWQEKLPLQCCVEICEKLAFKTSLTAAIVPVRTAFGIRTLVSVEQQ